MLSRRVAQQSLRQLAVQQPAYRFAAPVSIALGNAFAGQRRLVAATTVSEKQASDEILAKQRLSRPVAPHLSIYKPQITWYLSILNRITGGILSGGFYIYGALYLIAPALGWHVESSVLAAGFAAWPFVLKIMTKFLIALPFTFHSINGVRHLIWDTASMINNKAVNQSGWFVVGLSTLSALGLCFY